MSQNGMTPLHLAVWYSLHAEDVLTVKVLLEHDANCSTEDNVVKIFQISISTTLLLFK